ncbi:hypothetical protein ANN_25609 [Periplaneta americana]|uniref:Uncharacterized protein n=1 Tax=Periplaneta americana TaxID=6978 RepID=A0ABQ8S237_PERAM|nr:hypothetical protein ANN_25609 [Periplaneta americana]
MSRAVASWSKASYLGLALRNARWFESSWGKKFSHEISASVWDRCPPSIVMHLGSNDRTTCELERSEYPHHATLRAQRIIAVTLSRGCSFVRTGQPDQNPSHFVRQSYHRTPVVEGGSERCFRFSKDFVQVCNGYDSLGGEHDTIFTGKRPSCFNAAKKSFTFAYTTVVSEKCRYKKSGRNVLNEDRLYDCEQYKVDKLTWNGCVMSTDRIP